MVRDAYANYVVQTTLDVISECEEKELLLAELSSHSTELVSTKCPCNTSGIHTLNSANASDCRKIILLQNT